MNELAYREQLVCARKQPLQPTSIAPLTESILEISEIQIMNCGNAMQRSKGRKVAIQLAQGVPNNKWRTLPVKEFVMRLGSQVLDLAPKRTM
jgi:hypothetical protein